MTDYTHHRYMGDPHHVQVGAHSEYSVKK